MPRIHRQTLTKIIVEGVKSKAKAYRLWDAKVPGLALRVLPTGRSSYEVHWRRNRALVLGTNGVMTLEGARVAARRVLGEVAEHGAPLSTTAGVGKGATFGEFLSERYGPHIVAVNKAGTDTLAALNAQFGHLSGKSLGTITKADFDAFQAARLAAEIHPSTVNRDLDRLKAALSQALEWGLITSNPLSGVKRLKRGIDERVRHLSPKEEKSLRDALSAREAAATARRASGNTWREARGRPSLKPVTGYSDHLMPMTLLALNTGMRRGELTELHWEDINFRAKVVTVRSGYAKSGTGRHIPLNKEAIAVLRTWQKTHSGEGVLFDVTSVTTAWRALIAAAKIKDFRFHDLRHTFASNLVMAGVALNTVRELMGHSDIQMTLRYAHLAQSHKADAVAKLGARRRI